MLESVFGNASAEKVLFHVFHYGEIYAAAVAEDYKIAITPLKSQLERFEEGGILVSKLVGRTRVYSFNEKSPFAKPIRDIIKISYESIPIEERQKIFKTRRRPRQKNKAVIS